MRSRCKILVLGSCFGSEIGAMMASDGYQVCVNPFGTIYNPVSVADSLEILSSDRMFSEEDCVPMGAGAGKICSWHHYTKFARPTSEEFLENANSELLRSRAFWQECDTVIVFLATSYVWEHETAGIVANCLKRDSKEFKHRMLSLEETSANLERIAQICEGKRLIFNVCPIPQLWNGAHSNTLSKAVLHLGIEGILGRPEVSYFPSYEIVLGELRDPSWFKDGGTHPGPEALRLVLNRLETEL